MHVSASRVLLELLTGAAPRPLPASGLVQAAQLFGVSENNVRVSLARLVAGGALELSARGMYRLSRHWQSRTSRIASWRDLAAQERSWDGHWLCVRADLPVGRQTQAERSRAVALSAYGFRWFDQALALRPDNLDADLGAVRAGLITLGLGKGTPVFRAGAFDAEMERRARRLWPSKHIDATYVRLAARTARWLRAAPRRPIEAAAREAFTLGGELARHIIFDPRLPAGFVDVAARRRMLAEAERLDRFGRHLWESLFGISYGVVIEKLCEPTDRLSRSSPARSPRRIV